MLISYTLKSNNLKEQILINYILKYDKCIYYEYVISCDSCKKEFIIFYDYNLAHKNSKINNNIISVFLLLPKLCKECQSINQLK